jgi:predicted XRE-type DNA-binding protein
LSGFNRDTLKFNEDDILQILLSDLEQREISKKYNISQSLVSQIKTGKIYKHLFPDILRVKEPIIGKNDKLYTKYC